MRKLNTICIFVLLALAPACALNPQLAMGDGSSVGDYRRAAPLLDGSRLQHDPAYTTDEAAIFAMRRSADLSGLVMLDGDVAHRYATAQESAAGFSLQCEIAIAISSGNYGDLGTVLLKRRLAANIAESLLRSDACPFDVATDVAPMLRGKEYADLEAAGRDLTAWSVERSDHAALWLGTLRRLSRLIKPGFDDAGPLVVDNALSVPSKDPAVNAERQRARDTARAENASKELQRDLRNVYSNLVGEMVPALVWSYSHGPRDLAGLNKLFDKYSTDPAVRADILSRLSATSKS